MRQSRTAWERRWPQQLIGPFRRSHAPVFAPLLTRPTTHPNSYTDSAAVHHGSWLVQAIIPVNQDSAPFPQGLQHIFIVIQTVQQSSRQLIGPSHRSRAQYLAPFQQGLPQIFLAIQTVQWSPRQLIGPGRAPVFAPLPTRPITQIFICSYTDSAAVTTAADWSRPLQPCTSIRPPSDKAYQTSL